jgi:hypothetical protein
LCSLNQDILIYDPGSKRLKSDWDSQALAGSPCPPLANQDGQTSAPCPLLTCHWFSLPLQSTANQVPGIQSHITSMHTSLHILAQYLPVTGTPHCSTLMKKDVVHTHLVEIHKSSHNIMNTISDAAFTSYDLHPCQVCNNPQKIYMTLSKQPMMPSKHPYSSGAS